MSTSGKTASERRAWLPGRHFQRGNSFSAANQGTHALPSVLPAWSWTGAGLLAELSSCTKPAFHVQRPNTSARGGLGWETSEKLLTEATNTLWVRACLYCLKKKKKSCKTLLSSHSMSHIPLFTGAFYNSHHYVLGLAENERRAWGNRLQLVCHIQASFLDKNIPTFLDLTVPLIYLGNSLPVLAYLLQIQGTENIPFLVAC